MNPVSEEEVPGLEQHLKMRATAAAAFYQAEAKTILYQALRARERHVVEPAVRQIAYFCRKGKGSKPIGYRGPARVVLVEKGTAQRRTPTIVWLTYGGQLIRCAPEHLRATSNLECRVEDLIRGQTIRPGQVIQGLRTGGIS
jgi:hypothetical protein